VPLRRALAHVILEERIADEVFLHERVEGLDEFRHCVAHWTPERAATICGVSAVFSAIFYGIAVIWERDLGIVHKLLVSPASRLALLLGQAVASDFRGIVQTVVIYLIALALGVRVRWEPGGHRRRDRRGGAGIGHFFDLLADHGLRRSIR
jgi:anaerobic selenocysteine-containing dehydrogenase